MRCKEIEIAVAIKIASVQSHAGLRQTIAAVRGPGLDGHLDQTPVAVVAPEQVGFGVVGHVQIEIAVAVQVVEDDPHRRVAQGADSGGIAHVQKRSVAPIAVDSVRLPTSVFGSAVHVQTFVVAFRAARRRIVQVEFEVVGHVQIEPPIAIDIPKGGARAPATVIHSSGSGNFDKAPRPIVAPELVGTPIRDVQIDIAVVVVVPRSASHAPAPNT